MHVSDTLKVHMRLHLTGEWNDYHDEYYLDGKVEMVQMRWPLKVAPRERSLATTLSTIEPHERSLATILSPIAPRERSLATVLSPIAPRKRSHATVLSPDAPRKCLSPIVNVPSRLAVLRRSLRTIAEFRSAQLSRMRT